MSNIIHHIQGYNEIKEIFKAENIGISETMEKNIFEFLGKLCCYEEEEEKIKPLILLGNNLDDFFLQSSYHYKTTMFEDSIDGKNFPRIVKALVPLCVNNWYIFINICSKKIFYGIFRQFLSPTSVNFEELFFDNSVQENENEHKGVICIKPYDKNSFIVKSRCKGDTVISFTFQSVEEQVEAKIIQMKEDIISGIMDNKDYIDKAVTKMLMYMPNKLHGALCLIVSDEYEYPNKYLHGVILEPKLDFVDGILATRKIDKYEDAEKYYAITNLVFSFMNIDGITVINNKGQVIGYNAFYRSSNTPENEVRGARRRTSIGLTHEMEKKDSNILGVYYQSQDGNYNYKRKGEK